jgi:ABC-2 type transport system permease protein
MTSTMAMAYREYRIRLTNPILPLWDIVVPVVYLVVFGLSFDRTGMQMNVAGAAVDYSTFLLGGVLAMVTFSVAMNSSYAFFEDLQSGIFHELLTYPLPRRDFLVGKLLFNAIFGVLGSALCLLAARLWLGMTFDAFAWLVLLVWTFVGTAAWFFFFAWLSLMVRGFNAYHTTTSSMYLFLMFLSNLFYPVESLPLVARVLAYINPITWQVDIFRRFTYGEENRFHAMEAIGFFIFLGVAFWLADRKMNNPSD